MADDLVIDAPPPETVESPILRPAEPGEASDAAEARGAREAAGGAQRSNVGNQARSAPEPKPPKPSPETSVEVDNPYERHVNGAQDNGPELLERSRLNAINSYYRGTLAGAGGLAAMARVYEESDPADMDPGMKEARENARKQYETIVADLIAYDVMPTWSGLPSLPAAIGGLGAAVAGSVGGSIVSPESFAGWAAKGSTWVARTMWTALQQGVITGVTDPAVQALNIGAGVQHEWDPMQSVMAPVFGAALGATFHAGGEGVGHLIGQRALRKQLVGLGEIDKDMVAPDHAQWAADPRNGIEPVVSRETATPPERPAGPTHGFEDTVAAEKKRLSDSYGAAQPKAATLNEEARFSAFQKEVGPQAETLLTEHGFDPRDAHELYQHYDRAPGEHPDEALKRATLNWYDAEERAALTDKNLDSAWRSEMDELDRHFASREGEGAGTADGGFRAGDRPGEFGPAQRSNERTAPRGDDLYGRPESDIPFESGVPAREGGAVAESGAPVAREPGQTDAGGATGADGGAGGRAAEAGRGERVVSFGRNRDSISSALEAHYKGGGLEEGESIKASNVGKQDWGHSNRRGEVANEGLDVEAEANHYVDWMEGNVQAAMERLRDDLRTGGRYEPHPAGGDVDNAQILTELVRRHPDLATPEERTIAGIDLASAKGEQADLLAPGERGAQALVPQRAGLMPGEERRAVWVDPTAVMSPAEVGALKSRHELSLQLADLLDFPIRQGKVTMPGAAGMYVGKSGVVRVKEIADFEVVKHEAAHAMEAKIGPQMTSLIQANGLELGRLDYDPAKLRPQEGFAEWMRVRITNPAGAQRLAPNFNIAFDTWMGRNRPDMLKIINDIGVADRAWLNAEPLDALGAVVKETFPDGKLTKAYNDLTKDGIMATPETILQKLYEGLVDTFAPVERALRDMAIELRDQQARGIVSNAPPAYEAMKILPSGLVEIKGAYDSSVLIRSAARAQQTSYVETQFGIIPFRKDAPEGPSVRDFLNTALGSPSFLGKWNPEHVVKFDNYLVARMSEYLWRRWDQGLIPNEPSPIKPSEARKAIADLETEFPQFKQAADQVQEFQKQVRRKLYESGMWDKDTFDYTNGFEFYIPMRRVMEPGPGHNGGPSLNDNANLSSRVQRFKGSERDVISPLRNIMRQVYFMEREIRQNEINLNFLRQAEAIVGEGGKFAERLRGMESEKYVGDLQKAIRDRAAEVGLPDQETRIMLDTLLDGDDELLGTFWRMKQTSARGEPIVFGWENGKPVAIRLMSKKAGGEHAVFESMSQMPQPVLDVASNIITFFGSTLRSGVIYDPMFPLTNYIKDQLQVALTQPGYIPFIGGLKGIASEIGSVSGAPIGEVARQRAYAGGIMGGTVIGELERNHDIGIQELAKQGYLVKTFTSWQGLLEATQVTEAGTRNSIFEIVQKQKIAQGLTPYEAMMEAGGRADDLMPFSRAGSWTQLIRRWVPFLSANVVGQDRYTWRQMIEPQLKQWMGKDGGIVTLRDKEEYNRSLYAWGVAGAGSMAMGAAFAASMWARDGYRDAMAETKGKNFVIPLDNGKIFMMPKPFEMSIGFTAGEFAYASWFEKDPRAAAQFADAVNAAMSPPHPIYNLPLIGPMFELDSNYSHFRQGPIVPDNLQNRVHPELEYNDGTSSLAKWVGKNYPGGMSPMKVDYAIGAFFGTVGSNIAASSSMVDQDTPTAALDETMFVKRFIKSEERSSGRRKQFWDLMAQKNGKYQLEAEAYRSMTTEATRAGQESPQAAAMLAKMPAAERAYVIMSEAANAQGKPAFNADEKRLHPLARARDAATILSSITRDLQSNTLVPYREKEKLQLDPDQRRKLIDDIRTMAGAEMRNAFVTVGEPGYVGRPIYDTKDYMDVIERVSPNVAQEIATRYATAKIYSAAAVQEAWPILRDEVTTRGSDANIKGLAARVRGQGFEFGGVRAKKPGPIRLQITPEAAPATP